MFRVERTDGQVTARDALFNSEQFLRFRFAIIRECQISVPCSGSITTRQAS